MSDKDSAPSSPVAAAVMKPSKPKSTHPPTAEMVIAAIAALHERGGSSLQAIKKYVTGTYMLDADKISPYIKKYLKSAVASGMLIQTKGHGASGSFKLPPGKTDAGKTKKVSAKTAATKKTVSSKKSTISEESSDEEKPDGAAKAKTTKKKVEATKSVTKKPATAEKAKKASPKKTARLAVEKSPSKMKNVSKSPTTKPKAPKPKKIAAPKNAKKVTAE